MEMMKAAVFAANRGIEAFAPKQGGQKQTGPAFDDFLGSVMARQRETAQGKTTRKAEDNNPTAQKTAQENRRELDPELQKMLQKLKDTVQGKGIQAAGQELRTMLEKLQKQLEAIASQQGQQIAGQQLLCLLNACFEEIPQFSDLLSLAEPGMAGLENEAADFFLKAREFAQRQSLAPSQAGMNHGAVSPEGQAGFQEQQTLLSIQAGQTLFPQWKNAPVSDAESSLQDLHLQEGEQPVPVLAQTRQQGQTQPAQPKPEALPPGEKPVQVLQGKEEVIPQAEKTPEHSTGEHSFVMNVKAAKQNLEQQAKPDSSPKKQVAIDELQQQVDAGVFLRKSSFETEISMAAKPEAVHLPVAEQLEQGVLQGLKAGSNEFVIRMMPEGLGEVTVSLSKTADGMLLHLVAKNGDTQKLLTQEMNQLRDLLRPMRIEVDPVVGKAEEQMMFQQQNYDGNQRRHRWQDFKGPAYYGEKQNPASDGKQEAGAVPVAMRYGAGSGLYAYI